MSGGVKKSDAAERSQGVYFCNLKEDMLLDKELTVLRRAEKSLTHRIAIDQKVLFKRFQAKLRRSKIARARLWGDKETERALRARDLHVMNSNCGQQHDDLDFLAKLEQRPCVLEEEEEEEGDGGVVHPHHRPRPPSRPQQQDGMDVTDEDTERFVRAVLNTEQGLTPSDRDLRSLSTIGRLMEEAQLLSLQEADRATTSKAVALAGRGRRPLSTTTTVTNNNNTITTTTTTAIVRPVTTSGSVKPVPTQISAAQPGINQLKSRGQAWNEATDGSMDQQKREIVSSSTTASPTKLQVSRKVKVRPQTCHALQVSRGASKRSKKDWQASETTTVSSLPAPHAASPPTRANNTRAKSAALGSAGSHRANLRSAETLKVHNDPVTTGRTKSAGFRGLGSARTTKVNPDPDTGGTTLGRGDTPAFTTNKSRMSTRAGSSSQHRSPSPYKHAETLSPQHPQGSRNLSARAGGTSSAVGSRRASTQPASPSMFEEQKKVDWVALRLEAARNTDLAPKVSAFLKTLLELDKKERISSKPAAGDDLGMTMVMMQEGPPPPPDSAEADLQRKVSGGDHDPQPQLLPPPDATEPLPPVPQREEEKAKEKAEELKGDSKFDYYASKMALQAASVRKERLLSLPGTPEEVNGKLVGDTTIRSITMPRLVMDPLPRDPIRPDPIRPVSYTTTNILTL